MSFDLTSLISGHPFRDEQANKFALVENIDGDIDDLKKLQSRMINVNTLDLSEIPERQILVFGLQEMEAYARGSYPAEFSCQPKLYVCERCLHFVKSLRAHLRHRKFCTMSAPPGKLVYTHDNLFLFEVSGKLERTYCSNLSLLSKLFIEAKSQYRFVAQTLFYVLTERRAGSYEFIGYYSRSTERNFKRNNVACIMVLPIYQQRGFGMFLIDHSYLRCIEEGLPGTPERPLSALGVISYESYWAKVVKRFIHQKTMHERTMFSMKDMVEYTGMTVSDIVDTLVRLKLLLPPNTKSEGRCRIRSIRRFRVKTKVQLPTTLLAKKSQSSSPPPPPPPKRTSKVCDEGEEEQSSPKQPPSIRSYCSGDADSIYSTPLPAPSKAMSPAVVRTVSSAQIQAPTQYIISPPPPPHYMSQSVPATPYSPTSGGGGAYMFAPDYSSTSIRFQQQQHEQLTLDTHRRHQQHIIVQQQQQEHVQRQQYLESVRRANELNANNSAILFNQQLYHHHQQQQQHLSATAFSNELIQQPYNAPPQHFQTPLAYFHQHYQNPPSSSSSPFQQPPYPSRRYS